LTRLASDDHLKRQPEIVHDVCPRGGRRLISDNEITFRSAART
jgi:hypothetical protein